MQTKEPYFQDELTEKSFFAPNPQLLKIPNTTDLPNPTTDAVNIPSFALRRLSMEPYYKSTSRRNTLVSTGSSYAMLSDVFDYHYLDQNADNEHAIVSESDTDYEDDENSVAVGKRNMSIMNSDGDSDSELEDYKVHFLTFKVTSRAQYSIPPRSSTLAVSDMFEDSPISGKDFNLIPTLHHPKFTSPPLNRSMRSVDYLDDTPEQILAAYELHRNNPLTVTEKRHIACSLNTNAPGTNNQTVSDDFEGAQPKTNISDVYDTPRAAFMI